MPGGPDPLRWGGQTMWAGGMPPVGPPHVPGINRELWLSKKALSCRFGDKPDDSARPDLRRITATLCADKRFRHRARLIATLRG